MIDRYSPLALYFAFTVLLIFLSGNTSFGNTVVLGLGIMTCQVRLKGNGYHIPREIPQFFSKLNLNSLANKCLETILHLLAHSILLTLRTSV